MTVGLKFFGRMSHCAILLTLSGLAVATAEENTPKPTPVVKGPLSPEESLKHFVLADPNLQIEIVATEPEVIDPVAIQFDEHGRLWVVEMSDYPNGPEPGKPPLSRIKLLEDKDGDGRYETAHVFADKLLFATGVQPWDGGVIVTLAGEVAYFKDTDGDHKADVRETWFTGFVQQNPQLRANHPTFGPDGWIYVANGLRGGNVIAVKKDWPVKVGGEVGRAGGGEKNKVASPDLPTSPPPNLPSTGQSHDPTNPVPVSLAGRDFKFDPLTGRYEAISGNGQYGMTFDAWGNRFVCDNRHPCRQVIFEEDFIRRCPHVAFPAVVHDVIPPDDKNKVFPLTSAWTTSNLHAGTFTAACGVCVYTGDWLPEDYRGNVFVCEPTGNLVQRAVLEPDGVTFKSHRGAGFQPARPSSSSPNSPSPNKSSEAGQVENLPHEVEFLASRDDWFRPVDLQNGPDGALYVVDMYRAVIEHPEWVPDELKNRPDTWLGNDKGRIYRIREIDRAPFRPKNHTYIRPDLPKQMANPFVWLNWKERGWYRATASRMLHERLIREGEIASLQSQLKEVAGSLIKENGEHAFFNASTCSAIWTSAKLSEFVGPFDGLNNLLSEDSDELSRVMLRRLTTTALDESADRATRDRYTTAAFQLLFSGLQRRHSDKSPFELQVVQTWQALAPSSGVKTALLVKVASFSETIDDPWLRLAMIASADEKPTEFLLELIRVGAYRVASGSMRGDEDGIEVWGGMAELFSAISEQVGKAGTRDDLTRAVVMLSEASLDGSHFSHFGGHFQVASSGLLGVTKGLSRRRDELNVPLDKISPECIEALAKISSRTILLSHATDPSEPHRSVPRRQIAIRLLSHLKDEASFKFLSQLAADESDQTLRMTAIESFASLRRPEVEAWLVEKYCSETPAIRRTILSSLMASKERQLALLGAIAEGKIAATEIDPVRAKQLTDAKDEAVREKARQVLAAAAPASRKEVLEAYQPALTLKADPQRGREVFQKNCVTCHRIGDLGVNVAPDISDTRTKKPEQLLLDILDPNRAIDANYFAYAVVTKDGKVESGVIASESSNSITLKQPEGKVLTLLRTDIDELRNTGLSLMPVGVEKNINPQQMADLIFWLKNWRYLDGKVPATSLGGK